MQRKKIAYISGTRADFGLMTPVLKAIEKSEKLSLQVYATGMHLMPEYGNTVEEVRNAFPSVRIINAVWGDDSPKGTAEFSRRFLSGVFDAFNNDRPDFVLTLGDRLEMLNTATACLSFAIPIGHIHGGEKTGTIDETARHAITKLSHVHFPATKESAKRIKKLGEEAWRIHVVGAPALDIILHSKLPSKREVMDFIYIKTERGFILVTQHPTSENWEQAGAEMRETLEAVKSFHLPVVVIYPNADMGGQRMIAEIEKERSNSLFRVFPNVPYDMFLALEREAAAWVGNSSAALIESVSFKTPVINIGTRQKGRERGGNVIDVGYDRDEIIKAVEKSLYDKKYMARLKNLKNPWGDGRTAGRVVKALERLPSREILLAKRIVY